MSAAIRLLQESLGRAVTLCEPCRNLDHFIQHGDPNDEIELHKLINQVRYAIQKYDKADRNATR